MRHTLRLCILLHWIPVLLLCHVICIHALETLWLNTTLRARELATANNITCAQTNSSSCIINCNSQYACGYNTTVDTKPHIVCPQYGSSCIVNCLHNNSCTNIVIDGGHCERLELNIHGKDNSKMTVNAPTNGDLYIHLLSNEAAFTENVVHAHDTNRMIIHCNGSSAACNRNQYNAESVVAYFNMTCSGGTSCDGEEIHCPDTILRHLDPKCHLTCMERASCSYMHIFAMNGTSNNNGIAVDCDGASCDHSRIYCRNDETCTMMRDDSIASDAASWYCNGACGDSTSHPTVAPTFVPTVVSETDGDGPIKPNVVWLPGHNTTNDTTNESETGSSSSKDYFLNLNMQDIKVLGYVAFGGVVGGTLFCMCTICLLCCFVERSLKKWRAIEAEYKSNGSSSPGRSTVSVDYNDKTKRSLSKRAASFGGVFLTEVSGAVSSRYHTSRIMEDDVPDLPAEKLPASSHVSESSNDAMPAQAFSFPSGASRQSYRVLSTAEASGKPRSRGSSYRSIKAKDGKFKAPSRSLRALSAYHPTLQEAGSEDREGRRERSSRRSRSKASPQSSETRSPSHVDHMTASTGSSSFQEFGNTCKIEIESNHAIKKRGNVLETESVAIRVSRNMTYADSDSSEFMLPSATETEEYATSSSNDDDTTYRIEVTAPLEEASLETETTERSYRTETEFSSKFLKPN